MGFRRWRDEVSAPDEEREADFVLEVSDQAADGRLGDMNELGRSRHATRLHDGAECFDLAALNHRLS